MREVDVSEKVAEVEGVEIKVPVGEEAHVLDGAGEWRIRSGKWIIDH